MITIMMIINNKKVTFHWFLLICISTLVLGRVDIGLRKGSCFSLIMENIVQLGVIFCKRTRYAGNDITQLAQSPQKWVFELCNYQRKVFGRINMSLDNIYIFLWSSLQKTEAIFCFLWCILVWGKIFGNLMQDFFVSYSLWISFILLNFSLQVSFSKTYVSPPNHECIVFCQQSFLRNIYNLCIYLYSG